MGVANPWVVFEGVVVRLWPRSCLGSGQVMPAKYLSHWTELITLVISWERRRENCKVGCLDSPLEIRDESWRDDEADKGRRRFKDAS